MITRMLAGVGPTGRPLFLKMVYHGPKAMEELVRFDPHLVVGILGGSAGTTRDAFQLLHDAQKYGAKVALFGRKINNAENQLAFVHFLRLIVEGQVGPVEAVKAYHAVLGQARAAAPSQAGRRSPVDRPVDELRGHGRIVARWFPRPAPSPFVRLGAVAAVSSNGNGHCQCHAQAACPEGRQLRPVRLQRRLGRHRIGHGGFPIQPRRLNGHSAASNGRPDFTKMSPVGTAGLSSPAARAGRCHFEACPSDILFAPVCPAAPRPGGTPATHASTTRSLSRC